MAKNYLNLDHMARHLPQALKTKSDQPHSLLSDEEPMDDEGSGAKNRSSDVVTDGSSIAPDRDRDNFFMAKLKQAKAGGVRTLIALTNLLNLGDGKADKNQNEEAAVNSLGPGSAIRESKSLHDLPQVSGGDGPSTNLTDRCNSWVELRELESGATYNNF